MATALRDCTFRCTYGIVSEGLSAFALARATMDAPKIGGAESPAVEYLYSVSEDGGETYRNPTLQEQHEFEDEIVRYCRDCGDVRKDDETLRSMVMPCGHVAHLECHVTDDRLSCRYARSVDDEMMASFLKDVEEAID